MRSARQLVGAVGASLDMSKAIRAAFVACASFVAPHAEGVQRTFVSASGVDTQPCSLSAPCRTFGAAIAKTTAKGEVIVLDSAGYGPVTITKSVSLISPPGIYAGVTVTSGDGITINAPGATIVLRGLSINGQGGDLGVKVMSVANLRIESCVISGMGSNGVVSFASGSRMIIVDSIVRDTSGTGIGISADASVVLDHVRSENNVFDGFYIVPASAEATATISDSVFADNGGTGVRIDTIASATTYAQVEHSTIAGNAGHGFSAVASGSDARANVTLMRSSVHRNGVDGVLLSGNSPALVSAFISESAIAGNSGDGVHLHGASTFLATYVKVSLNTLQQNLHFDLYCDDSTGLLIALQNNSLGTAVGVGSCLGQTAPY
jgi:hypothetical protein